MVKQEEEMVRKMMAVNTNNYKFLKLTCDECGVTTEVYRSNNERYIRRQCANCGKTLRWERKCPAASQPLLRNQRNYKCSGCGEVFSDKEALQNHRERSPRC